MITFNQKPESTYFNLIITKNQNDNEFIVAKNNTFSIDTRTKTIYWFLEQEKTSYLRLSTSLTNFLNNNNYNLNLDFKTIDQKYHKVIIDTIMFNDYPRLSYKTSLKKHEKNYNFCFEKNTIETQLIKNQSINIARDLCDTPPDLMTPEAFCEYAVKLFKNCSNVRIEILNEQRLAEKNVGLINGVARGNLHPARMLIIHLNKKENPECCLIGKGVTFDSGGYCLKSGAGQLGMKNDMAGAAIVLAAIYGLAICQSKKSISAICGLTENLIGNDAMLVSTVLTAYDGQTVEVLNTDAEGRLVLADCISYASRDLRAKKLVTIATLTGAVTITLGKYATAAFANNQELYDEFAPICDQESEKIWQLPVYEENFDYINNGTTIADMCNAPREEKGASSNAAAFLFNFAKETPLMHLDIGGTGVVNRDRGTGVMVKSFIEWLK